MLLKLYEFLLKRKIKKVPGHVVIIDSGDISEEVLTKFVKWCKEFGIKEISICVEKDLDVKPNGFKLKYVKDGNVKEFGDGDIIVNIVYDSGKEEIVNALRKIAELVIDGKMKPEDVDEKVIEEFLSIKSQPDLIIKAGNEIPRFLIWQSIYSELYFADIDWKSFRYVDFLRILREYQRRERRYGR